MENVKENRAKSKKLKHALCYLCLITLIVLLFVPHVFRIVFKEKEKEEVKDVVTILKCNKEDESISSTFLNDEPKNLAYKTTINFINEININEEENKDTIETNTNPSYQMVKKFLNYSNINYDETNNTASININTGNLKDSSDYVEIFGTIALQERYFASNGFVCSQEKM